MDFRAPKVSHIADLLSEKFHQNQPAQVRFLKCLAQHTLFGRLAHLQRARRHLDARFWCEWMAKDEQLVLMSDIGENFAFNSSRLFLHIFKFHTSVDVYQRDRAFQTMQHNLIIILKSIVNP